MAHRLTPLVHPIIPQSPSQILVVSGFVRLPIGSPLLAKPSPGVRARCAPGAVSPGIIPFVYSTTLYPNKGEPVSQNTKQVDIVRKVVWLTTPGNECAKW